VGLLLVQIVVILALCRALRGIIVRLGQPAVIGEILAGLLLGPSCFGWIAPSWYAHLFVPSSLPLLNALSQVGLVIFMFLVGLRLDLTELYNLRSAATSTALLSIILPFSAGIVLSRELRVFAAPSTPGLPFALFIGVSMSITAFPVLARILSDRGLTQTRLGHLSIACAAFDDVTGWTMLACVTAMIRSDWTAQLGSTATILLIYVAAMLLVGRPLLKWSANHFGRTGDMSLILIIVFLSSWASDFAGIHALFGAFLAGALSPHAGKFGKQLASVLEPLVMTVLLPLFFSYTGIRTNIGLLSPSLWLWTLVIIAVAVAGKMGGGFSGAALMGLSLRDSVALGALMNTRGLVELVVLNVGLEIGILTPALFTMLVLMALTTTLMTSPILNWVLHDGAVAHAASAVVGVDQARSEAPPD
jgi:Kef-type K+ transport system membrane component KefB